MVAKTAQQFLADIRQPAPNTPSPFKNSPGVAPAFKAVDFNPALPTHGAPNPHPVAAPTGPVTASELDALYGKGSQVPGTHPHTSGLKAVYDAGAAGKRA